MRQARNHLIDCVVSIAGGLAVVCAIVAGAVAITRIATRHRERMARIGMGFDPDAADPGLPAERFPLSKSTVAEAGMDRSRLAVPREVESDCASRIAERSRLTFEGSVRPELAFWTPGERCRLSCLSSPPRHSYNDFGFGGRIFPCLPGETENFWPRECLSLSAETV